jgi:sterol desaturase/sphingolipid hydroxylase (fatty acid hydroxylase superfamily)
MVEEEEQQKHQNIAEISHGEFINSDKKWVIVDNMIYDVSMILDTHPGGKKVLELFCKTDATDTFNAHHNSSGAPRKKLDSLIVGKIANGDDPSSLLLFTAKQDQKFYMDKNIPLVPQVQRMKNPSIYTEWIHKYAVPIVIDGGTRLFISEVAEILSRWPWWYIYLLWVPLCAWLMVVFNGSNGWYFLAIMYLVGLVAWQILEYMLHRFVFHFKTNKMISNYAHFLVHGLHHLIPTEYDRLTFPPAFSLPLSVVIFYISYYVGSMKLDWFFSGLICGYLIYDTIHFLIHYVTSKKIPLFDYMKKRHDIHHYVDSECNFGVTTPIFDLLFGTAYVAGSKPT